VFQFEENQLEELKKEMAKLKEDAGIAFWFCMTPC
jgi:hypothetical protein